ncbi:MAG: gliding motility-associated C-terminal domain-containing protein, partial [Saprospiraceae bacterium]|nr:gliding motility-associated C-terminal domain-containing protein [Saprospiraceae bacterium]
PNGCDSLVQLNLQIIQCEIQGVLQSNPVVCNGESSGSLQFSVANGTPPFTYGWERVGGNGPFGTGTLSGLNQIETISNLPKGSYTILVKDNFGNDVVFIQDVTEPPVMTVASTVSDFKGFHIRCAGDANGTIALATTGGVPGYAYAWSNAATSASLQNLSAGLYTCTVTDAQGCSVVQQISLEEPAPLTLEADFQHPGCEGPNTGKISVKSTTGGVLPYTYDLSGSGFSEKTVFSQLSGGDYVLKVMDGNGCEQIVSGTLITPLIPTIELGHDLTVDLAESAQIVLVQNTPLDSFIWSLKPGLSCYDCPEPVATPYETTTFVLTAEAPGGCTDTDSITVFVQKVRDVYVPNVFTPNDDGENDFFTVYGGPEVQEVRLEVYSRWGELVYRHIGAANDESTGWDGIFRGDRVSPGVFVWRARILFVDGVTLDYEGNVTVLR